MHNTVNRLGESCPVPFRSGRFFNVGSQWYFACREGFDKGPFESRQRAERALQEHITRCSPITEASDYI
jgi:hypothetical protein